MDTCHLRRVAAAVLGASVAAGGAFAQQYTVPPASGPAENGSPAWFLQGSFPDPGGRTSVDANGVVTVLTGRGGAGAGAGLTAGGGAPALDIQRPPGCRNSPVCGNRLSPPRGAMQRVQWEQTMGYTFTYPYVLPPGTGGVPAVALDSTNNLWVLQRKPIGMPQLFKFDANQNLVLEVGPDVLPYQLKAHGMAVDAEDNVWVLDTSAATATQLSPAGELLQIIGERGRRGDWDEARGQRLLWEPVMIAFAANGDIYIAQGHGNESPNDTGSDDPANTLGSSRILHLDRNGNYVNQWHGNYVGPGKFNSAHGLAVDPVTGDVWIGDREDYRIVIYSGDGTFLRTIQTRNLVCAIQFDPEGNPWMASGQDGQFLELDRETGRVIGAIGNGMGIGHGQFIEASYWVFDKDMNLYAGDTSVGRVTKMLPPQR